MDNSVQSKNCYIYTRVSTTMQVSGYSLDAQKDKIYKYAQLHNITVKGEYSDEGKSGKSANTRQSFLQMFDDIRSRKDDISFVIVFKLSRFGRNTMDVLSYLEELQKYDVNLICVEDGIDSSKATSKLLITILASVAEIERENIHEQTLAGRYEKARQGRWNGGIPPLGYEIDKENAGVLKIVPEEAEIVKEIFNYYIKSEGGLGNVAKYLKNMGITPKGKRYNHEFYSKDNLKHIIDNEVYIGKIRYGRTSNKQKLGTSEYHRIVNRDYQLVDGLHEPIISNDVWNLAQEKRIKTKGANEKIYDKEHLHLLTGMLLCPKCGNKMYTNVNRRTSKNGTVKSIYYYCCKHHYDETGKSCSFNKSIRQEKLDAEIIEIIKSIFVQKEVVNAVEKKINTSIDTEQKKKEIDAFNKKLVQLSKEEENILNNIARLDVNDLYYDKKNEAFSKKLDEIYSDIEFCEKQVCDIQSVINNIARENECKINAISALKALSEILDKIEKKDLKNLLNNIINYIYIYEEEKSDASRVKAIELKIPVYIQNNVWEILSTVETVVLLSKKPQ